MLIDRSRMLLGEFLAAVLEPVDKARKRFLQKAIRGILFSESLVVMELRRWVRDDCSDRFYQVKRLLNPRVSPQADLRPAICRYRQAASPHPAGYGVDPGFDGFGQTQD